jgi:hypothetical protein
MKLSVGNIYSAPEAPKPEQETSEQVMKVARESFDVDFSEKKEKPKGQIGKLYSGLVGEAMESGKLDSEKSYEATGEEVKAAAKLTMRERGEYLEKYNPEAFDRVIELRSQAKMVKGLLEQAAQEEDFLTSEKFRLKAKDMGNYDDLIREAVELFNISYAEIEDKVKEERESKEKRKQADEIKLEETRRRIEWLHSEKNPDNTAKKGRLAEIERNKTKTAQQEKWGRSPEERKVGILKPIPGTPFGMAEKPTTFWGRVKSWFR